MKKFEYELFEMSDSIENNFALVTDWLNYLGKIGWQCIKIYDETVGQEWGYFMREVERPQLNPNSELTHP